MCVGWQCVLPSHEWRTCSSLHGTPGSGPYSKYSPEPVSHQEVGAWWNQGIQRPAQCVVTCNGWGWSSSWMEKWYFLCLLRFCQKQGCLTLHIPHHMFSKGKCNRAIAKCKLHDLVDCHACQAKAWFDEAAMLEWVNTILAPYIMTAQPNLVPIFLLDSFSIHMKAMVLTTTTQNLVVEVFFISPGWAGLMAAAMDVWFNKCHPLNCLLSHGVVLMPVALWPPLIMPPSH